MLASDMFTGKERDIETGLDYFGTRYQYLSSAQGRFLSAESLVIPKGDAHRSAAIQPLFLREKQSVTVSRTVKR